jgi:putative glutamine amidotransferase
MNPDRRLASILGTAGVDACSWHHQAIDKLGAGLKPAAWSEDGVIEAVEHTGHPWCIGVQWHPEMQLNEDPHRRLFSALVAAAKKRGD